MVSPEKKPGINKPSAGKTLQQELSAQRDGNTTPAQAGEGGSGGGHVSGGSPTTLVVPVPLPPWEPLGKGVTICSNVYAKTKQTHEWDVLLTSLGAIVLTPCHMPGEQSYASVHFSDFAHTRKIDSHDHILVIANDHGSIDAFMLPWVMHAFAKRKRVYCDTDLGFGTLGQDINVAEMFKPYKWYPITREQVEIVTRRDELIDHGEDEAVDLISQ